MSNHPSKGTSTHHHSPDRSIHQYPTTTRPTPHSLNQYHSRHTLQPTYANHSNNHPRAARPRCPAQRPPHQSNQPKRSKEPFRTKSPRRRIELLYYATLSSPKPQPTTPHSLNHYRSQARSPHTLKPNTQSLPHTPHQHTDPPWNTMSNTHHINTLPNNRLTHSSTRNTPLRFHPSTMTTPLVPHCIIIIDRFHLRSISAPTVSMPMTGTLRSQAPSMINP